MRRLKFTKAARDDLNGIVQEIVDQTFDRDGAESFGNRLLDRCRRLASLPGELGSRRDDLGVGLRSTPHGNYRIIFRYLVDDLEIVAIIHARRDVSLIVGVRSLDSDDKA